MLDSNDLKLIEEAKKVINKNFDEVDENHTVGAALRCKNGNIYVGVNVYMHHGSCAEYIALGTAITEGEREFDTIVAVKSPKKNNALIPPCGNCRQLLMQYAPDIKVLIQTQDRIQKVCIKELLPYSAY